MSIEASPERMLISLFAVEQFCENKSSCVAINVKKKEPYINNNTPRKYSTDKRQNLMNYLLFKAFSAVNWLQVNEFQFKPSV